MDRPKRPMRLQLAKWSAVATEQLLKLNSHTRESTRIHPPTHTDTHTHTHTHTAVMLVVTCPLDYFHHVGWKVAHSVISCAVVVNAAFPSAVRVLLQNLPTHTYKRLQREDYNLCTLSQPQQQHTTTVLYIHHKKSLSLTVISSIIKCVCVS